MRRHSVQAADSAVTDTAGKKLQGPYRLCELPAGKQVEGKQKMSRKPKPRNAAEAYEQGGMKSVIWSVIMLVIIIVILIHL